MTLLYFYAVKREEISRIVPLFAFSSVFVVILSAIFLQEIFSIGTYFGIAIIVAGAFLILLKTSLGSVLKSPAFSLTIGAAIATAIHAIIIKHLTNYYSYWTVFGWITLLDGTFGLLIFFPQLPSLRQDIKKRGWRGVQLVLLSDTTGTLAPFCFIVWPRSGMLP